MRSALQADGTPEGRYLDLLELALIGALNDDPPDDPWHDRSYQATHRVHGLDWPSTAPSMIGLFRLRQLREAAETCIREGIEGDFIETGVWRGGACILLSGVLQAYSDRVRRVFVADSFSGLPAPTVSEDKPHVFPQLTVGLSEVVKNFVRFALLNDQVVFVPGWFSETLPTLPTEKLSILRADGDLYASTLDALSLYPKLSPGGFCIIDDFLALAGCRRAVLEFRTQHKITAPLVKIDDKGVYWRKE